MTMDRARTVLRRHWGYDDFRSGQREVIAAVLDNRDVLAILPTGGGSPFATRCRPCWAMG